MNPFSFVSIVRAGIAVVSILPLHASAGGYVFANFGDPNVSNGVSYPQNYTGQGGPLNLNVCIVPGTPNASKLEKPLNNAMAVWNQRQSTTSNVRTVLPDRMYDIESHALHEFGHCMGLAHTALGHGLSGVTGDGRFYTLSRSGPDGVFGLDPGADGVVGTADDVRGDDVNNFFFQSNINNPFVEFDVVDSSTYTNDLARLPSGDLFAASPSLEVSATARFKSPFTESAMVNYIYAGVVRRTLGHDDVNTLRFAMSGTDRIQGTADDFIPRLVYGGISSDPSCDIKVAMDSTKTAAAACQVGLSRQPEMNNFVVGSANMWFSENYKWYYNDTAPCSESITLTPREWKQISLPCQVGISSGGTVADVFGDDLGVNEYNKSWALYEYVYSADASGQKSAGYRQLALTDALATGKGYWIISNKAGQVVDVVGEYNSQVDIPVHSQSALGEQFGWNMVGMPFRFPTVFADTQVISPMGDMLSLTEADPLSTTGKSPLPGAKGTSCSEDEQPTKACKVARYAYVFQNEEDGYKLLSTASGSLQPFDAVWMYGSGEGYQIRVSMSTLERETP